MRIILVSPYFSAVNSGANERFYCLASELSKLDVAITVVVHKSCAKLFIDKQIPLITFSLKPSSLLGRLYVYCFLLVNIVTRPNTKVISDFFPIIYIPYFIRKMLNITYIHIIHDAKFSYDFSRWRFGSIYRFLLAHQVSFVDYVLTVSQFSKKEICKNLSLDPSKVFVSYNGINENSCTSIQNSNQELSLNHWDFLYVATFEKRKNHMNLVKALYKLRVNDNAYFKVLFVGNDHGSLLEVKNLICKLGLQETIYTTSSSFSRDELISIYRSSRIFVSTSLYEGFGMPLIEALNYCQFICCSNIPIFKEILPCTSNIHYFDALIVDEIYQTLHTVFSSSSQNSILDSNAQRIHMSRFNWNSIALKLLDDVLP